MNKVFGNNKSWINECRYVIQAGCQIKTNSKNKSYVIDTELLKT
jgi:hypothetical protein